MQPRLCNKDHLKPNSIYSQYIKERNFLKDILRVEIIDCINDSISVALPFNKEPKCQTFVANLTSRSGFGGKNLKLLLFTLKFLLKGTFHQISN